MYVHIFGYLVNKLEIWWVYLSPIEKKIFKKNIFKWFNLVICIILNDIINSGQESSPLYLYNTFHKFKINYLERCQN